MVSDHPATNSSIFSCLHTLHRPYLVISVGFSSAPGLDVPDFTSLAVASTQGALFSTSSIGSADIGTVCCWVKSAMLVGQRKGYPARLPYLLTFVWAGMALVEKAWLARGSCQSLFGAPGSCVCRVVSVIAVNLALARCRGWCTACGPQSARAQNAAEKLNSMISDGDCGVNTPSRTQPACISSRLCRAPLLARQNAVVSTGRCKCPETYSAATAMGCG